jgi:hypothetical protein
VFAVWTEVKTPSLRKARASMKPDVNARTTTSELRIMRVWPIVLLIPTGDSGSFGVSSAGLFITIFLSDHVAKNKCLWSEQEDRIDALFVSPGIAEVAPLGSITESQFDKIFNINVIVLTERRCKI